MRKFIVTVRRFRTFKVDAEAYYKAAKKVEEKLEKEEAIYSVVEELQP